MHGSWECDVRVDGTLDTERLFLIGTELRTGCLSFNVDIVFVNRDLEVLVREAGEVKDGIERIARLDDSRHVGIEGSKC